MLEPGPQVAGDLSGRRRGDRTPAGIWSEQDTTPGRRSRRRCASCSRSSTRATASYAPARVLNLVVVVDREWRGEIANRLERVGRYHASRTILCAVEPAPHDDRRARSLIDGRGRRGAGRARRSCASASCSRSARSTCEKLDTIVDPLVVTDLADGRLVAARPPRGRRRAAAPVAGRADRLGQRAGRRARAVTRAQELAEDAYVVDLAWLRSTPWRERVAATFDPPQLARRARPDRLGHGPPPPGVRRRPGCCSSAGWRRGWAGSPAR